MRKNLSTQPRLVAGVGAFAERYQAFLVDQWGVLHDGQTPFPGAVECLRRLRASGKQVAILSNSGKRAADNAERLRALGIDEDCYTALVTSGEVARDSLAARGAPFVPSLGRRCLLLSSDGTDTLARGLDVEMAETVAAADFILLAGVADEHPMAYYLPILEYGSTHEMPLVCVNPDLVRFSPQGLTFSAGELARRYEQMGGTVHYIGKPHEAIYRYCGKVLADFAPSRTVAIGDSVGHDVVGGARAGLDTALVTDGIHQADFADAVDDDARLRRVSAIAREHGVWPDWVIRRFAW
ncbi:MAG TPA: TIGR01459 family HAD-type hydrolase [Methylococcaceae bacterium]|nr:TIGR01459 family HAD-type hydrolase [Methylococcaceae bacterium]